MYYRINQDVRGAYLSAVGKRYALVSARNVRPQTGWTFFLSEKDCLAAWKLLYNPLIEDSLNEP